MREPTLEDARATRGIIVGIVFSFIAALFTLLWTYIVVDDMSFRWSAESQVSIFHLGHAALCTFGALAYTNQPRLVIPSAFLFLSTVQLALDLIAIVLRIVALSNGGTIEAYLGLMFCDLFFALVAFIWVNFSLRAIPIWGLSGAGVYTEF